LNTADLTYLLNKPEATNEKQTIALENVVLQYPYFQSARALHLKGLYNQDSFRYNYELKKTAAYTTDRTILFEFITSDHFATLQQDKIDAIQEYIQNINVEGIEEIKIEKSNATATRNETNVSSPEEKLGIGAPLNFSKAEKHSFQEWLQLTKLQPISRETPEITSDSHVDKEKKIALIDKFLEANPKIAPVKEHVGIAANSTKSIEEPTHLMTETLAKVFLEQKKYHKAIQAYEILILKYPEKSSFFADQINEIKNLQQNNN
jgi:hypothetical protein